MCTQQVLRKNHRLLVNNLDLTSSKVLDRLHEDDVISSGEQEDILRRNTSRDQNTRLLFLLKRRDRSALQAFINALKADYGYIVDILSATPGYEKQESEETCAYCRVVKNLIPSDVTHFLYEEEVIVDDDDLEDLNNENVNRTERVKRLLNLLGEQPERAVVEEKFYASLKAKYTFVLESVVPLSLEDFLSCHCKSNRQKYVGSVYPALYERETRPLDVNDQRSIQSRSLETLQTTENEYSNKIGCQSLKIGVTQNVHETKAAFLHGERQQCEHSWDEKNEPQDGVDEVDACDVLNEKQTLCLNKKLPFVEYDISSCDSTSTKCNIVELDQEQEVESHSKFSCKTKNNKEKSKITHVKEKTIRHKQYKHCCDKNTDTVEDSVTVDEASVDNKLKQVCHVRQVLPNNSKLMKMCKKLWDQLFFLREKGEWETFSLVTSKAFDRFADNPDIQVLLFRSEMCVSTFYKSNPQKAQKMYERALDLVPKTSMPSWHLARILPLKVAMCTQEKKFEEASSLLEQAHQAMTMLAPCLSSGAVFFFEAIYLSAVLRCSRTGSKSSIAIAEKVKECFLTAIYHYQQEPYFAIESFLNQVYLFLALFVLRVDCKNIRYFRTGTQSVDENNISLADHYLNLFENNYWDKSTTWSRMLFFIGRGEQHKLRKSLSRSLDYFREAKECARIGGYEEHLGFIKENMEIVTDRLEEQLKIQELQNKSADAILKSILESSSESSSSENYLTNE